jgi:small basic protein
MLGRGINMGQIIVIIVEKRRPTPYEPYFDICIKAALVAAVGALIDSGVPMFHIPVAVEVSVGKDGVLAINASKQVQAQVS